MIKNSLFLCLIFALAHYVTAQEQNFLYTKSDDNIAIITMGKVTSSQCTIFEYPDFIVINEVPKIPARKDTLDKSNPLITYLDSIYSGKPIKYILNSHYHGHSLSTVVPFIEKGAKLVTAKGNMEYYNKKGLFGENKTNKDYKASIIEVSADTILLANSKNPIEVLYLEKSKYKSIPTKEYLFFNFPKSELLSASCMVYLKDLDGKDGYKGFVYSDRLVNVEKIITDKKINPKKTLQLHNMRLENGVIKAPIFPITHLHNTLEHSWHRFELSEHYQKMENENLIEEKDTILNFFVENSISSVVLNHAVYMLMGKKEYQKAVTIAKILIQLVPDRVNEIDTLGEAYYNNGQINMAKHYDKILKRLKPKDEGYGMIMWEKNKKASLEKDKQK